MNDLFVFLLISFPSLALYRITHTDPHLFTYILEETTSTTYIPISGFYLFSLSSPLLYYTHFLSSSIFSTPISNLQRLSYCRSYRSTPPLNQTLPHIVLRLAVITRAANQLESNATPQSAAPVSCLGLSHFLRTAIQN